MHNQYSEAKEMHKEKRHFCIMTPGGIKTETGGSIHLARADSISKPSDDYFQSVTFLWHQHLVEKIPSEMKLAPRYTLLTLFILFKLLCHMTNLKFGGPLAINWNLVIYENGPWTLVLTTWLLFLRFDWCDWLMMMIFNARAMLVQNLQYKFQMVKILSLF